jgi:P4 family phage/plasmid primase-like protien
MEDIKIDIEELENEDRLNNYSLLKQEVNDLLLKGFKTEATEHIAKFLEKNNKIYSIQNDIKKEVWVYKEGIYVPQGKTHIEEFTRKILGVAYTTYLTNQVIAKIIADTGIDEKEFFNNNIVGEICCKNGIVNLRTKELTPFNPNKIFFSKINASYNPNAKCPAIENHFKEILKNPDDADVLFEFIGFCLWKDYFIEKAVMFLGSGRNGKGKTLSLINNFLGLKNCSKIDIHKFDTDPYSAHHLFGKLANISGDLSPKALNNTGLFKNLTGRDPISAQRKFMTDLEFVSYAKMMFACNVLPKTADTTLAFFNRWMLFEFPYTFLPKEEIELLDNDQKENVKLQNPNQLTKLSEQEELDGLLNKALEGLERILKNNCFSNSQGVNETKKLWIRKSDSFTAFFNEKLKLADFDMTIPKNVLKKEYSEYCKKNRLRPLSDKIILNTITGDEFRASEGQNYQTGERFWCGVAFKEEDKQKSHQNLTTKVSCPKVNIIKEV